MVTGPALVKQVTVAFCDKMCVSFSWRVDRLSLPCLCRFFLPLGVGFGLMYLPSIVIVSYYFTRHRALATGFAVCGSGIGILICAPVARHLLQLYGWRGANLILAGLVSIQSFIEEHMTVTFRFFHGHYAVGTNTLSHWNCFYYRKRLINTDLIMTWGKHRLINCAILLVVKLSGFS